MSERVRDKYSKRVCERVGEKLSMKGSDGVQNRVRESNRVSERGSLALTVTVLALTGTHWHLSQQQARTHSLTVLALTGTH